MPEKAIHKLLLFSGGVSAAARKHLSRVTHTIIKYCSSSQYKHEDVKMCLFAFSLEGDAIGFIIVLKILLLFYKTSSMLLKIDMKIEVARLVILKEFKTILHIRMCHPLVPLQVESMIVENQEQVIKSVSTMKGRMISIL